MKNPYQIRHDMIRNWTTLLLNFNKIHLMLSAFCFKSSCKYRFSNFYIIYTCHMIKIKPHSYRTCLLSHGNSALRPRAAFQQTRPQLMWFYHYIPLCFNACIINCWLLFKFEKLAIPLHPHLYDLPW